MRFVPSYFCVRMAMFCVMGLTLFGCRKDADFTSEDDQISLKWNKGYDSETIQDAVLGLKWALSSIGASVFPSTAIQSDEITVIQLNTAEIGLPAYAIKLLRGLHQKLKITEEYRVTGTIDLGRYIVFLIGASEHYYRLVDMPETLAELQSQYTLNAEQGFINNSFISAQNRILYFSDQVNLNQLFVTAEIDAVSGEILEYETLDIMSNGNVRFGIFNTDGQRVNAADPTFTSAGKPAKCMWCHETKIQPLFAEQDYVEGYIDALVLADTLAYFRNSHHAIRLSQTTGIDFSQHEKHTLAELLYITFMEPTTERLAIEWSMPIEEVEERLAGLPTHIHPEFPLLGDLYWRKAVSEVAPFSSLPVPSSAREFSLDEVNHFE